MIGNDVWLGYGVKILEGISIGDGVVVGTGSIITKDIPPYEIWGGIPAKKMQTDFPRKLS
jgi:acetyltransferase-like isoleucine patch superfamily enzyme